ncbi:MAG: GrpB family protein, partial [Usitatibacter sp.]
VELVDPDPSWAKQYETEAAALFAAIGPTNGLRLEHFGSTAIPNIRAKPIIDIFLIHPQPATWQDLIDPTTSLGYVYWADNPRTDRMFFVKGMPPFGSRRTHRACAHASRRRRGTHLSG